MSEKKVVLETSVTGTDGGRRAVRLVDGPRPAGMGWEAEDDHGTGWYPCTLTELELMQACIALWRRVELEHADSIKAQDELLRERQCRRLAEAAELKIGRIDEARNEILGKLVKEVQEHINLLVKVESWPDMGFLRYAREDLQRAVNVARGGK